MCYAKYVAKIVYQIKSINELSVVPLWHHILYRK